MKNRLPIAISLFALSATALVMDGGAPAGAAIGLTPVLSPVWSAAPSATSSIHETAAAAKRRGKGRAGARSGAARPGGAEPLELRYVQRCVQVAQPDDQACSDLRKTLIIKLTQEEKEASVRLAATSPRPHFDPLPAVSDELATRWGPLARLVGTFWADGAAAPRLPVGSPPYVRPLETFSWSDDGKSIVLDQTAIRAQPQTFVFRPGKAAGTVMADWRMPSASGRTQFRVESPDRLVSDWYTVIKPGKNSPGLFLRQAIRINADGQYDSEVAFAQGNDRPDFTSRPRIRFTPEEFSTQLAVQSSQFDAYTQKLLADAAARTAEESRQLAAENAARPQGKGGGGFFGKLLMAGVGAAAVQGYGGTTEQALGAALKGAALGDPDNALAGGSGSPGELLGSVGGLGSGGGGAGGLLGGIIGGAGGGGNGGGGAGGLLGGLLSGLAGGGGAKAAEIAGAGSLAGALTEGAGAGAGAGVGRAAGKYPVKPNLAVRACAGFTEQNYRSRALSGGGDQQLLAMCGQAFEYYTMYKRAIAQGYSEADADRTYAAHKASAQVAQSYLQNNAAD